MEDKKTTPDNPTWERRWHTAKPGRSRRKKIITDDQLHEILAKKLKGRRHRSFRLYSADNEYYCTPLEDAQEILDKSKLERKKYFPDRFDCDDYALVLKSHFAEAAYKNGKRRPPHCFGIVWGALFEGEEHAINWMINDDEELRLVEPQTDEVYTPQPTDKGIWFMMI